MGFRLDFFVFGQERLGKGGGGFREFALFEIVVTVLKGEPRFHFKREIFRDGDIGDGVCCFFSVSKKRAGSRGVGMSHLGGVRSAFRGEEGQAKQEESHGRRFASGGSVCPLCGEHQGESGQKHPGSQEGGVAFHGDFSGRGGVFPFVQFFGDFLDHPVQGIAGADGCVLAARVFRQEFQRGAVQFADDHFAASVAEEAVRAGFVRYGVAGGRAYSGGDDDEFGRFGVVRQRGGEWFGGFSIGDQDEGVGALRSAECFQRERDDVIEVGAAVVDPAVIGLFQGFPDGVVVVSQRHDERGFTREDDEAYFIFREGVEQVKGRRPRLLEAGGLYVARQHTPGDVYGDQQIASPGKLLYFAFSPLGAGHGGDQQG